MDTIKHTDKPNLYIDNIIQAVIKIIFNCFEQPRLKINITMKNSNLKANVVNLYNDKNKNINKSFTHTSIGCVMEFKLLSSLHFVLKLFT